MGSVFKSWSLLESGFADRFNELFSVDEVHHHHHHHHESTDQSAVSHKSTQLNNISLSVRFLTQTSAIGAAYYAALSFNKTLPIDFSKNYTELSTLSPGKIIQGA